MYHYFINFIIAFALHHIISYYIILYHFISFYIILYHIVSFYFIYHIISYCIILYHISFYIILYHIILYIILYHIVSLYYIQSEYEEFKLPCVNDYRTVHEKQNSLKY